MRNSLLVLALVAGCRDEFHLPPGRDAGNAAPLAQAGTGSSYRVLSTVTVDGRGSFDPDGSIVAFHWTLISAPPGNSAALSGSETSVASFVPDKVGVYALRLRVADDAGAIDTGDIMVMVVGPALVVDAGVDLTVPWLSRVQLSGSMTVEAPFTATYQWSLVGGPAGSAAVLANASSLTPTFLADRDGTYTISLTARSDFQTLTDQVTVVATTVPQMLDEVQEVEYSPALDRLIVIGYHTTNLKIHDPSTGVDALVDLTQLNPTSLSLQRSGMLAAVFISTPGNGVAIVDLQSRTLERLIPTPDASGAEFGLGNRLYTMDMYGQLITLDAVTTGAVASNEYFGNEYLRIDPSGAVMYLFPSFGGTSATRVNISTAALTVQHQVDVDAQVSLQPPVYFTADGSSVITSDGVILRTSANAAVDLTVRGMLGMRADAFAHSLTTHEFAVLTAERDSMGNFAGTRLTLINDTTLVTRLTTMIPRANGQLLPPNWIGYRADGRSLLIVAGPPYSTGNVLFVVTPP